MVHPSRQCDLHAQFVDEMCVAMRAQIAMNRENAAIMSDMAAFSRATVARTRATITRLKAAE